MSTAGQRVAVLGAVLFAAWSLPAQCSLAWLPGDGVSGANGLVDAATSWDPDGAGPLAPRLVIAGSFTLVGDVAVHGIAVQDPITNAWSALGSGADGAVLALATLPNGDLVAGGVFTTIDGVPANRVARWNGTSWSPLGAGPNNGDVRAFAVLQNGDLAVGGFGATTMSTVMKWDGTSWSSLGLTMNVVAMAVLPNGHLVAGGTGPASPSNVREWDGASWSPLGTQFPVTALTALPNGTVVAAMMFSNAVSSWNGTTWSVIGTMNDTVLTLAAAPNGDLFAGGWFSTVSGSSIYGIARWNGVSWTSSTGGLGGPTDSVPSLVPQVRTFAVFPNGEVVAGGLFGSIGNVGASNVARWNGASWLPVSTGCNAAVTSLAISPAGDVVAGGRFTAIGTASAARIAVRSGGTWGPLSSGTNGTVHASVVLPNGDIVIGGFFTSVGGVAASNIARWNGVAWSGLGSGCDLDVRALAVLPNGDLVAGGGFVTAGGVTAPHIASWNGATWAPLGSGVGGVDTMIVMPNGELVVGGPITPTGGGSTQRIARWDGATWSALGSGVDNSVLATALLPNGDLIAAGSFLSAGGSSANRIARWNGSSWSPLGVGTNDQVMSLAVLPNGDVVAGGRFTTAGGVAASRIARWNGATWSPIGPGVDGPVSALAMLPAGELVVGGTFSKAGGFTSSYLARAVPTCLAVSSGSGFGCASSGGSNTLVADAPPWVDTVFHATGSGLPTTAIVLTLTSLTSVPQGVAPLSILFPQAGSGCDILVLPDILDLLVTLNGTARSSILLHNTPSLVGVPVHHQMIPIEVDALGAWVAVTATNALQLTPGAF